MTEYAIDAEGIELVYGDGTRAVDGIDLRVPTGEFFGFLGPNGAGKTTTIKTLVTLLYPTGGSLTVNGYDVIEESAAVRQTIGYMAQETSIDPDLTARENLRFACGAYGVPQSDRAERIDELLDLVDLADVADKNADDFSGGMKKRLDAATALIHRPPLVFLDEPTTGLDPSARNRLWEYFRRINGEGTTIFLTTQYLEEADQLCDRIGVISAGQMLASGSPTDLKREVGGEILEVELADDGTADRAVTVTHESGLFDDATVTRTDDGITVTSPVARTRGPELLVALRDEDVPLAGFNVREPTLDDVFFALTGQAPESGSESAQGDDPGTGTAPAGDNPPGDTAEGRVDQ